MMNWFYNLDFYTALFIIYIFAIGGTAFLTASGRLIKNIIHNSIK